MRNAQVSDPLGALGCQGSLRWRGAMPPARKDGEGVVQKEACR